MSEQQSTTGNNEPGGDAIDTVLVEMPRPLFSREWFFNREVCEYATQRGWRPFHVEGFRRVRGAGFPDLAMFRKDEKTGKVEMLVAELKRDADSEFGEGQKDWLEAFKEMGITTKVWRGDNSQDLTEMYDIIEKGTAGHDSVTAIPIPAPAPIPTNFGAVMTNTIESIESAEMTTGEKASLRRMDYANPASVAFWKLISQRGLEGVDIEKWGLITHGIALMAHRGVAHRGTTPVGRSLYLGGEQRPGERGFYSENRLATLLAARGPALHNLLARLFRMLGQRGVAFNWHEMAWFILNEGHDEAWAEQSRIKIARAYYQTASRSLRQAERQGD